MKKGLTLAAVVVTGLIASGSANALSLTNTYTLSNTLADPHSNYHPQGLGYDTGSNELLFMQQSSYNIYSTDLTGNITGSQYVGKNHTTSVAGDGTNYYFSDYTSNSSGIDVYSIAKGSTGGPSLLSTEVVGYGGYPIDVRDGLLYRTEASTTYNYSNLNQVRISDISSPDTFLNTLTLAETMGIGDIAVDTDSNTIWTIDYLSVATIRQFDLNTGAQVNSFAVGLDGLDAGITYANGSLYYYDWQNGSGSTLSVFATDSITVPAPAGIVMFGLALLGLGLKRRS